MQVVPVPLNVTTVRSQNDLKPTISTFRNLSKMSPFVPHCTANLSLSQRHATLIPSARKGAARLQQAGIAAPQALKADRARETNRFVFGEEGTPTNFRPLRGRP